MTEETKETPEETPSTTVVHMLQESLKECQDKYLRLLAESENARKRMQKERSELTQYAIEDVVCEFLLPLDSFEKALKFAENSSEEVKRWAMGFEMILGQFKQVLTTHGVEEYDSLGHTFDPHLHDAVEILETTEVEAGKIVQEFTKGYRKGDRIIRVARVQVAKATNNKGE